MFVVQNDAILFQRRLVVYGEEKPEEENGETEAGETEDSMEEPVHEMVALRKRPAYNRKEITNKYDYRNRHLLDLADFYLEKHDFSAAMHHYGRVLAISGDSPRALFGRARAYLLMSEFDGEGKGTGRLLANAMADFGSVLENEETPDGLFRAAVRYFVECARLVGGQQHRIIQIQRSLVDRFPDEAEVQCELGATWLGMDRPEEAKAVFRNVLDAHPDNVLALAYLGYIWKVHDGELEKSVHALRRAMRSDDPTVLGQARFYFHLGDGLVRMGRDKEAREVYAEAAERGLFLSALQRSVHNLEGLSARPWWSLDQVECAKQLRQLERHWTVIREEALRVWEKRRTLFVEEPLQLASGAGGEWTLALRSNAEGGFHAEVCDRLMPSTCELLRPISASACAKDEMRLSVLLAGTRTWPQCGPTNYVLQAHLTLSSPSEARIRVGQETRGWRQGRVLVLDTSFEREISFEGAASNALRVAIVIELWHPEVPKQLRGAIQEEEEGPDEK